MFDKNTFKDAFRSWVENNPNASQEEALNFCQSHIPAGVYASNYWLVEQSLMWFAWLHDCKSSEPDDFHDNSNEDGDNRILC